MKINGLKLAAALFMVAGILTLYYNEMQFNNYVFIFNLVGISLFLIAIIKDANQKKD